MSSGGSEASAASAVKRRVRSALEIFQLPSATGTIDFSAPFVPHLEIVEIVPVPAAPGPDDHGRPPRLVFAYTVQQDQCNSLGNLHGGATATLFDICTSLAVLLDPEPGSAASSSSSSASFPGNTGVSRTLAVTYVRPVPCHTRVLVECERIHAGRRLIALRGILRRASDGAVLATCEHDKVRVMIDQGSRL